MALVSVMSAKGAPGASTTAMLLASLWPRPTLLVDADPDGGDLALRLLGADGRGLDRDRGLLSLLPGTRRGLDPAALAEHAQPARGGQPVVTGLAGPEQAAAVAPLWPALAEACAAAGSDVVVDAGQVHAGSAHLPLVRASDLVVWVYRPTAWSVLHTRRRLEGLADLFAALPAGVGVVAVAEARRAGDVAVAAAALQADHPWLLDLGLVAWDPRAVVMFEGGEVFRPERSLLVRSGRQLAAQLSAPLAAPEEAEPAGPVVVPRDVASTAPRRRLLRRSPA